VQVSKYRKVAEKLASLLHHSLATCFRAWRDATDHARVDMLQAERHAATTILRKLVPAWLDAADELKQQRQHNEAAADKMRRRQLAGKALQGWIEECEVLREQRSGLWRVLLLVLQAEWSALLQEALQGWHEAAAQQVALRACVASFVNKRRLQCLSEFLTLWHQYAAAMQTDGAALIPAALAAPSPAAAAAAVLGNKGLARAAMSAAAASTAYYSAGPVLLGGKRASRSSALAAAGVASSVNGPLFGAAAAEAASPADDSYQAYGYIQHNAAGAASVDNTGGDEAAGVQLPAGVLPVTGGPGSPLLGPRSAHQDRRLARRLAAMGGGAAEVGMPACIFEHCLQQSDLPGFGNCLVHATTGSRRVIRARPAANEVDSTSALLTLPPLLTLYLRLTQGRMTSSSSSHACQPPKLQQQLRSATTGSSRCWPSAAATGVTG
jgi:hypothetical protein